MKIVVFGAGGFIGGWLCEELMRRPDVELVACVRQWSSAVRLARRGVPMFQADLEEIDCETPTLADADVVVNLSVPTPTREPELALRLYRACAAAGVRKYIQASSIAVYGEMTGELDETTAPKPSNDYGRAKAEMERRLLETALGPQVIILRPSIVYGPFSENWTVRYARRIALGRWRSLGWAGGGTCNLVHGQDVARAIIAAAFATHSSQYCVLNINGPELLTWNDYIERFGNALDIAGRAEVNPAIFTLASSVVDVLRSVGSWAKKSGVRPTSVGGPALVEAAQSIVGLYPTPGELHLLRQKVHYSWNQAERAIGFRPIVSLECGLKQSASWCRTHGIIS